LTGLSKDQLCVDRNARKGSFFRDQTLTGHFSRFRVAADTSGLGGGTVTVNGDADRLADMARLLARLPSR
jgi:hypothetical protein